MEAKKKKKKVSLGERELFSCGNCFIFPLGLFLLAWFKEVLTGRERKKNQAVINYTFVVC